MLILQSVSNTPVWAALLLFHFTNEETGFREINYLVRDRVVIKGQN